MSAIEFEKTIERVMNTGELPEWLNQRKAASEIVRDHWLRTGKTEELVTAILLNDESSLDHKFIAPVAKELLRRKEAKSLARLLEGRLFLETFDLWSLVKEARTLDPTFSRSTIRGINLFLFDPEYQEYDLPTRIAGLRRKILRILRESMRLAKRARIEDSIQLMDVTHREVQALQPSLPRVTEKDKKISASDFWEVISSARTKSPDSTTFLRLVYGRLKAWTPDSLLSFQKHLNEQLALLHRSEISALAFALSGGCGDDAFHYFKLWAISMGQEFVEKLVTWDIVGLQNHFIETPDLELFHYLAEQLYWERTKRMFPESVAVPEPSISLNWSEEELFRLYPELTPFSMLVS